MRTAVSLAAGLSLVLGGGRPLWSQEGMLNFELARQQFVDRQPRAAAHTLRLASVDLRSQVGRCKSAETGPEMMSAEPTLDSLANALAAGTVTSVSTLDAVFARLDHVMARHHQELAEEALTKDRRVTAGDLRSDLSYAAEYVARAAHWAKRTLTPDEAKAVDEARALTRRMLDEPSRVPPDAATIVQALGKVLGRKA